MSKEKDFLKQKVFKNKTVEDVFEDVYEDVMENKENLNSFIVKAIEIIGNDADKLLMFTKNINDLVSTGLKNTDMMMKAIEIVRRANADANSKSKDDEEELSPYDPKRLLNSVKNLKSVATA